MKKFLSALLIIMVIIFSSFSSAAFAADAPSSNEASITYAVTAYENVTEIQLFISGSLAYLELDFTPHEASIAITSSTLFDGFYPANKNNKAIFYSYSNELTSLSLFAVLNVETPTSLIEIQATAFNYNEEPVSIPPITISLPSYEESTHVETRPIETTPVASDPIDTAPMETEPVEADPDPAITAPIEPQETIMEREPTVTEPLDTEYPVIDETDRLREETTNMEESEKDVYTSQEINPEPEPEQTTNSTPYEDETKNTLLIWLPALAGASFLLAVGGGALYAVECRKEKCKE